MSVFEVVKLQDLRYLLGDYLQNNTTLTWVSMRARGALEALNVDSPVESVEIYTVNIISQHMLCLIYGLSARCVATYKWRANTAAAI